MEVKLFINQPAKNYIKKIVKNKTDTEPNFDYEIVTRWLNETRDVKCYVLCDKDTDNVKNIILLSKCDYDPLKIHLAPHILDYIYTFLEYRRNNFAYKMLLYIKKKEQITSFCSNDEAERLFKKAGYVFSGYDPMTNLLPLFRFP